MNYCDVVITTGNLKAAFARLKHYGIRINCDGEGNSLAARPEELAELCTTPPVESPVDGKWRFVVRMEMTQADKLPKADTPNFTTDRTDDEGFIWPDDCGRIAS